MKIFAFVSLLVCAGNAASSCPDDGRVEFLDVKNGPGFYMRGYYGPDSFMAYIYGKAFSKAETSKPTDSRYFFIDGIAYQQIVALRTEYSGSDAMSDAENLEAHYEWELAYVKKQLKDKGLSLHGHNSYGIVESRNIDGATRKFFIWETTRSDAKQYYLTTSSSFGVIGITLIGVKESEQETAKTAIDNYMYRYRILNEEECRSAS